MSGAVPFGAVLRSEWTKLRSLRSTWWCAAGYVVVVLTFGWLGAAVTDQAPSADFAVAAALTGFGFGQLVLVLVLVVLGVLTGATEFAAGTAVASFAGVPGAAGCCSRRPPSSPGSPPCSPSCRPSAAPSPPGS